MPRRMPDSLDEFRRKISALPQIGQPPPEDYCATSEDIIPEIRRRRDIERYLAGTNGSSGI